MDEIGVFTEEYIKILADRGFDTRKMRIFNKGIDSALFYPLSTTAEEVDKMSEIPKGYIPSANINYMVSPRVRQNLPLSNRS